MLERQLGEEILEHVLTPADVACVIEETAGRSARTFSCAHCLRRVSIENAWELRGAEHMVALAAVQGVPPSAQASARAPRSSDPSRSQLRRDARSLLTDVPSTALAQKDSS